MEQSSEARKLCRQLDGKSMVVVINVQPLRAPLSLRFTAEDDRVYMSGKSNNDADVEISGTLIELNRLMFSSSQRPLRDGRVDIQGDADIAELYRKLILLARPNLEEELVALVGDDAAPKITTAIRSIRSFTFDMLEDFAEQVSDYLKEDGNYLPARTETETFFFDVDRLSNDTARLEARLSRIREKLEKHGQGQV